MLLPFVTNNIIYERGKQAASQTTHAKVHCSSSDIFHVIMEAPFYFQTHNHHFKPASTLPSPVNDAMGEDFRNHRPLLEIREYILATTYSGKCL